MAARRESYYNNMGVQANLIDYSPEAVNGSTTYTCGGDKGFSMGTDTGFKYNISPSETREIKDWAISPNSTGPYNMEWYFYQTKDKLAWDNTPELTKGIFKYSVMSDWDIPYSQRFNNTDVNASFKGFFKRVFNMARDVETTPRYTDCKWDTYIIPSIRLPKKNKIINKIP
ncbi:MAG: hypothetical protein ACLFQV_06160 [Vulcanimicrobiota bacterium]